MRQYRIWNDIRTVGGRRSPVDYGANACDRRIVRVGTSARNSHAFADVATECFEDADGHLNFSLWVDGECVKRAVLRKGASELEPQRA